MGVLLLGAILLLDIVGATEAPPSIEPNRTVVVRLPGSDRKTIMCDHDQPTEWFIWKNEWFYRITSMRSKYGTQSRSTLTLVDYSPPIRDKGVARIPNAFHYYCVALDNETVLPAAIDPETMMKLTGKNRVARTIVTETWTYSAAQTQPMVMRCFLGNRRNVNITDVAPVNSYSAKNVRILMDFSTVVWMKYTNVRVLQADFDDTGVYTCEHQQLYYFQVYGEGHCPMPQNITDDGHSEIRVHFRKQSNPAEKVHFIWTTDAPSLNGCKFNDRHHEQWTESITSFDWVTVLRIDTTKHAFRPGDKYTVEFRTEYRRCGSTRSYRIAKRIDLRALDAAVYTRNGTEAQCSCGLSGGESGRPSAVIEWLWFECPGGRLNASGKHWPEDRTLCRSQPPLNLTIAWSQPNATTWRATATWRPKLPGYMQCRSSSATDSGVRNISVYLLMAPAPTTDQRRPETVARCNSLRLECLVEWYRYEGNVSVQWWHQNGTRLRRTDDGAVQMWRQRSDEYTDAHVLEVRRCLVTGRVRCVVDKDMVYEWDISEPVRTNWSWIGAGMVVFVLVLVACGVTVFLSGRRSGLKRAIWRNISSTTIDIQQRPSNHQAFLLPYDHSYNFPLNRLDIGRTVLGTGHFSIVYMAQAMGILASQRHTTVAVKTLPQRCDRRKDEAILSLIAELKIMTHIGRHTHVVRLLGAVTNKLQWRQLYLILEFCALGNLRQFLRTHGERFVDELTPDAEEIRARVPPGWRVGRPMDGDGDETCAEGAAWHSDSSATVITSTELLIWSLQAARGMKYLGERNILHGDLAARNCLLNCGRVLKICDFGLSRVLEDEQDEEQEEVDTIASADVPLPIKWMSIESLRDRIFNTATDVWSYGVLLWEIFSLGRRPYDGVATDQIEQRLVAGHRMLPPPYSTHRLHELMRQCWQKEARLRPTFGRIGDRLLEMLPAEVAQLVPDNDDGYERAIRHEGGLTMVGAAVPIEGFAAESSI